MSSEDDVVTSCVDAVGYTIKQHGAAAIAPVTASLAPWLLQYLQQTSAVTQPFRVAALCLCDDMIEYASPAAATMLVPVAAPSLIECADATLDATLRQPAVYGLGVCMQHGGEAFTPFVARAVALCVACVGARSETDQSVTDNAVSTLIKAARFRRGVAGVDADALMRGVIAYLPLRSDAIEARLVHGLMVDALAAGDELWLGARGARLGPFLTALAACLSAHKAATSTQADAGGADDDEDEEDDADPLFTEESLALLRRALAGLRASPLGAQAGSIIGNLKRKQRAALAEFGLA